MISARCAHGQARDVEMEAVCAGEHGRLSLRPFERGIGRHDPIPEPRALALEFTAGAVGVIPAILPLAVDQ
tara:strand:+ start:234 stop:446 length:213 start_codon:yes stop_codon:yes gene_type:complete